jgi:membrane-bound lytic murein transglycosylase B
MSGLSGKMKDVALGFRLSFAVPFVVLCAGASAGTVSHPEAAAQAPVVMQAPQPADQPPFEEWLAALRAEALSRDISRRTVEQALGSVERLLVVVERDRTQAERVMTLDTYLKRRLTPRLVRDAKAAATQQKTLLGKASAAYGVPGSVMVAIWGLESNLGRFTGTRPVIAALATLAYDTRRAAYFREEIFSALRILDSGDVPVSALVGSWAGAMGQPQFMPSSYLKWAVDFDGDRRRDIWASRPDVLASIGNYLKSHGWVEGQRWGREVKIPAASAARVGTAVPLRMTGGCTAVREMTEPRPLRDWAALGVRLKNGSALPAGDMPASLVRVDTHAFLVYANYEALLAYNCAHTYALSVAMLSDRIGGK